MVGIGSALAFSLSASVHAQNTWHVDISASTNGNGLSWSSPFNNLQTALTNSSLADDDLIKVAQGVYKPHASDRSASFIINKIIVVEGGYAGNTTASPNDRDIDAYVTVLSGDLNGDDGANFANYSDNSYHVVTFANANLDNTTVLEGFTIRGGNATGDGGGIRMTFNAEPRILRCIIKENRSDANGGGASCGQAGPQFRHCTFQDNEADLGGGGLYTEGITIVSNCVFQNNTAQRGGGIAAVRAPSIVLANCTLLHNESTGTAHDDDGGGGAYLSSSGTAVARLINCLVAKNITASVGGGVRCAYAEEYVSNCTFADNSAYLGGGIALEGTTSKIDNAIIWNNSASQGSPQIFGSPDVCFSDVEGGWTPPSSCANSNINATPNFVNASNDDYHLQCPSPCANTGNYLIILDDLGDVDDDGNTTEDTPWDLDLDTRVVVPGYVDRGAYEKPLGFCRGEANGFINTEIGVNVDDLLAVINQWGSCSTSCTADVWPNPCPDGVVDVNDLLEVINTWGLVCTTGQMVGSGMPQSVDDCWDECEEKSENWEDFEACFEGCVEALCIAEIIECD